MSDDHKGNKNHQDTEVLHIGRNPEKQYGFVNPAVYRGSTVLFPTVEALETANQDYVYGRKGTPTIRGLEEALAQLENGADCFLTPSGLSAITASLMAFVESGDHILVTDSVYSPTRRFCDKVLANLGIEITYYDPLIGSDISNLIKDNTKLVFTESPGSQTLEIQDIPAICSIAKARNLWVLTDNTWATPLYFKPFEYGVDVSIHAATKYIVGHADAMLGAITSNSAASPKIKAMHDNLGLCPGPEDAYLALRGLRTLSVRLKRHEKSALKIAQWLQHRPEVLRVLHPALETDPGHRLWQRDFKGSTGLFSIILRPYSKCSIDEMLNSLRLFGMGWSWGGYESLIIPFNPSTYRTAIPWNFEGQPLRLHIGLDDPEDLINDLSEGFDKLKNEI